MRKSMEGRVRIFYKFYEPRQERDAARQNSPLLVSSTPGLKYSQNLEGRIASNLT